MYQKLVKNADILLFRSPPFPKPGFWISKLSFSKYSHVGIAKVEDDGLYCIEFREFRKSRKHKVSEYIKDGSVIDVFRVSPVVQKLKFDPLTETVKVQSYRFDQNVINHIIERAEFMIGRKYAWSSIKNIFFTYTPFLRLFKTSEVKEKNGKHHMCASFGSYLIRRYFVDPCEFLSDSYTKPGDLARSSLINYLFTLN